MQILDTCVRLTHRQTGPSRYRMALKVIVDSIVPALLPGIRSGRRERIHLLRRRSYHDGPGGGVVRYGGVGVATPDDNKATVRPEVRYLSDVARVGTDREILLIVACTGRSVPGYRRDGLTDSKPIGGETVRSCHGAPGAGTGDVPSYCGLRSRSRSFRCSQPWQTMRSPRCSQL